MFVSRHCDGVSGLPVNSTFGTRMLKAALAKTLSVKSERAVTPQTSWLVTPLLARCLWPSWQEPCLGPTLDGKASDPMQEEDILVGCCKQRAMNAMHD